MSEACFWIPLFMKKDFYLTLSIAILLMVCGCANPHRVIDVSDSVYKTSADNKADQKIIRIINIINKADDGKVDNPLFGKSIIPIKPATTTKETVEQDIKRFLEESFVIDKSAPTDITVTIQKADSYYVIGSSEKIPYVNLFTIFTDTEIGLNLRVLFEIENKGKVVSSYLFEENITTEGKIAVEEHINQSYKNLIATYRKRFFSELETRFINRYF